MKGIVYKEVCLFFKSLDKRVLFGVGALSVFLIFKAGPYAGFIASICTGAAIGMQTVMCTVSDEKVNWKKYQLAMPVSVIHAVAGKYLSVFVTLAVSIAGGIFFNLFASIVYGQWDFAVWGISILATGTVPLAWTSICLPLTYWFGYKSAQVIGILYVFPMTYLMSFLDEGSGMSVLLSSVIPYSAAGAVIILVLFGLSFAASAAGYARKSSKDIQ